MNLLNDLKSKIAFSVAIGLLVAAITAKTNVEISYFISKPIDGGQPWEVSQEGYDKMSGDFKNAKEVYSLFTRVKPKYSMALEYGLIAGSSILIILLLIPSRNIKSQV